MSLIVEAVYEDGCLKLAQPLPFKEHEKVKVTLQALELPPAPAEAEQVVRRSYGLIGWKGDHETLERLLAEAEEMS